MSEKVKLWKENRTDQEYEIDLQDLSEQFLKSDIWKECKKDWPLQRMLRAFICSNNTGLNSSFEEQDYMTIHNAVRASIPDDAWDN